MNAILISFRNLSALKWKQFILIGSIVLIFDIVTKYYFAGNYFLGESREVFGDFFRFTYHTNPGIAFGIVLFENRIVFALFTFIAIVFIFIYLYSELDCSESLKSVILGLIIGGAIGNFIERALYGEVVDFLDFEFFDIYIPSFELFGFQFHSFQMSRFPIFNIADTAISSGMVLIFLNTLYQKIAKKSENE